MKKCLVKIVSYLSYYDTKILQVNFFALSNYWKNLYNERLRIR